MADVFFSCYSNLQNSNTIEKVQLKNHSAKQEDSIDLHSFSRIMLLEQFGAYI